MLIFILFDDDRFDSSYDFTVEIGVGRVIRGMYALIPNYLLISAHSFCTQAGTRQFWI